MSELATSRRNKFLHQCVFLVRRLIMNLNSNKHLALRAWLFVNDAQFCLNQSLSIIVSSCLTLQSIRLKSVHYREKSSLKIIMKLIQLVKAAIWGGLLTSWGSAMAKSPKSDVALITERRVRDLSQFGDPSWFDNIPAWLASQRDDGTWADISYASGCAASRLFSGSMRGQCSLRFHRTRKLAYSAALESAYHFCVRMVWGQSRNF